MALLLFIEEHEPFTALSQELNARCLQYHLITWIKL